MKKNVDSTKIKSKIFPPLARQILFFKKLGKKIVHNAKPFLIPRYWPIYILSFCLGFYLWGPIHGFQKLKTWPIFHNQSTHMPRTTLTLQRELNRLKHELKLAKTANKSSDFNPDQFSRPALGQVVQGFDWVETDGSWRMHTGIDIGVSPGSNILAAAAGTVTEIKQVTPGNYSVTINHGNSWKTIYSNLAKPMVLEGQSVIKGIIVGISGVNSCLPKIPSFHFAVYQDNHPIDPEKTILGLAK